MWPKSSGSSRKSQSDSCSCYLHPGECARDRPLLLFFWFSASWSKVPAGCEETDERSGDTEQLSVYIWSQISLMDGREEGTTFTRTWIPRRCQVSQVKAVLLLLKTFKIKAKKLLLGAEHRKWDGCTDLLNLSGYIHIYTYIFFL